MAMREGDWKFCYYFEDEAEEMFNLSEDIGEDRNLVATHPERAKRMRAKLVARAKSRKAPPDLPNPDYDPGN